MIEVGIDKGSCVLRVHTSAQGFVLPLVAHNELAFLGFTPIDHHTFGAETCKMYETLHGVM